MRRFLVAAMALVILGAALPARAENEGSGVYVGFVTHTLAANADLTAATETLRDGTTGALIPPIKDLLADPDLSFDAKLQEAGSGVRFGFNRAFSERFGVDLYGELGAVRSAFPLRENDAGGPKSKFSANAFDDDAFYFSLGAGIFGELPVEVGGGPMSWTARVAFSMNDNAVLNDSDTSGPLQEIESEIKYSAVMVEGTIVSCLPRDAPVPGADERQQRHHVQ